MCRLSGEFPTGVGYIIIKEDICIKGAMEGWRGREGERERGREREREREEREREREREKEGGEKGERRGELG